MKNIKAFSYYLYLGTFFNKPGQFDQLNQNLEKMKGE